MEWSPVKQACEKSPGQPSSAAIPTLNHNRLFKAYATPTVPKAIENKSSNKNIAQNRLQRLQNALRHEQKILSPPKPTKSPVKKTLGNLLQIPPTPPAPAQSRKRKAPDEPKGQTAEKKVAAAAESTPGVCKRVFLKATRASRSVQDRLKRVVNKPSATETSSSSSSSSSSNWLSSCASKTPSSPEEKSSGRKTKYPSEAGVGGASKRAKISQKEILTATTSSKTTTKTQTVVPFIFPDTSPRNDQNYRVSVKFTEDNKLMINYEENEAAKKTSSEDFSEKDLSNSFYVVVDTNIFCHNLIFVHNLLNMKSYNAGYPILIIPYIVLQELDNIKHQNSAIEMNCNKAIKFINEKLQSRHPQVQGQSAIHESDYKIQPMSNDDSIINCCLQVKEKTNRVILLSNDINLRNKAICNQINALTPKDLREDIAVEFL